MPRSERALFSAALVGVSAFAVASARRWPFDTALVPLAVGALLSVLAGAELVLELRRRGGPAARPPSAPTRARPVQRDVTRRRVATLFAWMAGFIGLVWLFGFPTAVPVFTGAYLGLQSRAGWPIAAGLAAAAWAFFHGVFRSALRLPFEPGWILAWLGW